jgi:hypothetical protein
LAKQSVNLSSLRRELPLLSLEFLKPLDPRSVKGQAARAAVHGALLELPAAGGAAPAHIEVPVVLAEVTVFGHLGILRPRLCSDNRC